MKKQKESEEVALTDAYSLFVYAIRTQITRDYYLRRLRTFFDFITLLPNSRIENRCNRFAAIAIKDHNWTFGKIVGFLQFQKGRVEREEITAATLYNFVKALKLFCEMSDIPISWKRITRGLPKVRRFADDRAPTLEEIQKMMEYPDRRMKAIVFTMASSGIRLGAWDYLYWKNIEPIEKDGHIISAKVTVYTGTEEEYFSFITVEAYHSLKDWMEFRSEYGETITGDTWVMRDIWQTSNMKYGAKFGLATNPKKLKSSGIKRLIEQALWEQGIRSKLLPGVKRHEWKAAHAFRVFYKTRTEQIMRPIDVEITMGHNIGLSACYYKPTEKEVLEDYLGAIGLLTISNAGLELEKEISQLKEKNKEKEFSIKSKLEEKRIKKWRSKFNFYSRLKRSIRVSKASIK